jgi:hypothetical protein
MAAVKKTFEQQVAAVTAETVQSMICNALFNSIGVVVYPQSTIDKYPTCPVASKAKALESFSKEEKLTALNWYMSNADFSAFKKWDCQAAINSLNV